MRELEYIKKGEPVLVRTVLKEYFGFSKGTVSGLKQNGGIFVNGENVTVRHELKENDILTIRFEDEKSDNIVPVPVELDIIYEDEDILAVNKPSGMATHPSFKHYTDTLANGVCYKYRNESFTFRAVNRLDLETSGIVIIAKNRNSAYKLGEQIKEGKIQKFYYAVCKGILNEKAGFIDKPIARKSESVILRGVSDSGKFALTEYKVISEGENSLLEIRPKTGRTHQIRVHFSYIGHPIVGDPLYGKKENDERLMLHCGKMIFRHPITGKKMTFFAKISDEFYKKTEKVKKN